LDELLVNKEWERFYFFIKEIFLTFSLRKLEPLIEGESIARAGQQGEDHDSNKYFLLFGPAGFDERPRKLCRSCENMLDDSLFARDHH